MIEKFIGHFVSGCLEQNQGQAQRHVSSRVLFCTRLYPSIGGENGNFSGGNGVGRVPALQLADLLAEIGISERGQRCSLLCGAVAFALLSDNTKSDGASGDGALERGMYIIEQVAMCVKCHTPRDQGGRLIRAEYLRGAPVPVKAPPYPNLKWAIKAPAIAGLPGYNKDQGVRLLTEGITASVRVPDPPMPRFRLTPADAEAVVAYLKSLP